MADMTEADKKQWFDRAMRQAAWPTPSCLFEQKIMSMADPRDRWEISALPGFHHIPLRQQTLFVTALLLLFCLGMAARTFIAPEGESLAGAYDSGPGLYMAENFLS
jgi:hypothetical protein